MRPTRIEEQEPPRADVRAPWWRTVPRPLPPGTPIPDPDAPFGAPVPVGANGRATLTTTALPVGTLAIRAAYGGDANLFGATSSPVIVTVR